MSLKTFTSTGDGCVEACAVQSFIGLILSASGNVPEGAPPQPDDQIVLVAFRRRGGEQITLAQIKQIRKLMQERYGAVSTSISQGPMDDMSGLVQDLIDLIES